MDVLARAEARGALGSAGGPETTELAAQLLPCGGPVVDDVLAQVRDVALEVHLVLLEPADVELLTGSSAAELAGEVLFVIANNPATVSKCSLVASR